MTKCIGCLRGYIKAWRKILCRVAYGVSFPRFGVVVWSEWAVTGPGWVCSASGALSGGTMACQATEDRHFWVPHHGEPSWKASVCVLSWMGPCWECEVESHLLLPAVVFSVRSEDLLLPLSLMWSHPCVGGVVWLRLVKDKSLDCVYKFPVGLFKSLQCFDTESMYPVNLRKMHFQYWVCWGFSGWSVGFFSILPLLTK